MLFTEATRLEPLSDTTFGWDVPDGWHQGRGAWGGLVVGGVVQAVRGTEPDAGRAVRSVAVHLAGPLTVGRATVRVEPVRVGSALSTWSVLVTDPGGDVVTHGIGVTGSPRAADLDPAPLQRAAAAPPDLPPWASVPPVPEGAPGRPEFMTHLEFRVAEGVPAAGAEPRCAGFVRFLDQGAWSEAALLAVVDAWFPTVLVALDGWRPLATVSFSAHLLVDPDTVPADEPLTFASVLTGAHEGFTTEIRRLWTADGRLAVENHQSVAVIR